MSDIKSLAANIYSRYGNVKRARGYFLYTEKGQRLTDLFLEGGRAILGWGHEGTGAFRIFKNVIERGITGSYQTCFENQLNKGLSELLGLRRFFIFNQREKALEAAKIISSQEAFFYYPWREENSTFDQKDCVIFEPTLPWTQDIFILGVKAGVKIDENATLPEESIINPPMCAGLARSIYDLIKALQVREEKDWFIYDPVLTKYWTRKGPWLFTKVPEEKYGDFVIHCLNCGLVINPSFGQASIVPYGVDRGNFNKLKKNPFEF